MAAARPLVPLLVCALAPVRATELEGRTFSKGSPIWTFAMRQRVWRARVRAGEIQHQILSLFNASRLRYIAHSWPLRPTVCPCDVHFCDYLDERSIRGRSVFHLGTGGHHLVGARNHAEGWRNEILGLTLAPREHARYVRRLIRDPGLGRHYKVLFADIYSLCAAGLPRFDLVALFHLCEFGDPASAGRRLDDGGVLRAFCSCLRPGGLLLLYRGSFGFGRAQSLITEAVADGSLSFVEDYKSLSIYRATAGLC